MQLDHESELAGVLGHELAHVTQRHIATRMERAQAVTIGSLVGALAAALLAAGKAAGHLRGQRGRRAGRHAQLQPHG
ncbi:MAG: M48 family metalloprotease [Bilophila wadsworthia]